MTSPKCRSLLSDPAFSISAEYYESISEVAADLLDAPEDVSKEELATLPFNGKAIERVQKLIGAKAKAGLPVRIPSPEEVRELTWRMRERLEPNFALETSIRQGKWGQALSALTVNMYLDLPRNLRQKLIHECPDSTSLTTFVRKALQVESNRAGDPEIQRGLEADLSFLGKAELKRVRLVADAGRDSVRDFMNKTEFKSLRPESQAWLLEGFLGPATDPFSSADEALFLTLTKETWPKTFAFFSLTVLDHMSCVISKNTYDELKNSMKRQGSEPTRLVDWPEDNFNDLQFFFGLSSDDVVRVASADN